MVHVHRDFILSSSSSSSWVSVLYYYNKVLALEFIQHLHTSISKHLLLLRKVLDNIPKQIMVVPVVCSVTQLKTPTQGLPTTTTETSLIVDDDIMEVNDDVEYDT